MNKCFHYVIGFLLFGIVLSSCVPTTTDVDASWHDPAYQGGTFKNVLVIAQAANPLKQRSAEAIICQKIKDRGIKATPGSDVISSSLLLNKTTLRPLVDQYGFDAIFLAELLGREQQQKEVVPASSSSTTISNGYKNRTVTYSSAATVVSYEDVYIDSKMYDVKTEKQVWHVQTKTVNPQNFDKSIEQISKTLVDDLIKGNFL